MQSFITKLFTVGLIDVQTDVLGQRFFLDSYWCLIAEIVLHDALQPMRDRNIYFVRCEVAASMLAGCDAVS